MIEIYFNNKIDVHKNNGPAFINTNGHLVYYKNGKFHREDGPALIWSDGDKWYYLNGYHYTKEEYYEKLKELNIK